MPDPVKPRTLAEQQNWFQAAVTHPDGVGAGATSPIEDVVTASRRLDATSRLSVYANAYFARLVECLEEVFPLVRRSVGEEAFSGFAFGYLQACPSHSYTLAELGRRFPAYLEETRPPREGETPDWVDLLVDLARLEWAIYEVFDGPGIEREPGVREGDLVNLTPEAWVHARLEPSPALRTLVLRFPLHDYFTRLKVAAPDEAVTPPDAGASWMALSRRDYVVRRHPLTRAQFEVLSRLQAGGTVEEAVMAGAAVAGGVSGFAADLGGWFRDWAAGRFFRSLIPGGA